MNKIRQIIREELYKMVQEVGEDPMRLSQDMVKSNEEQVAQLEKDVKFRLNDTRVQGLSLEEKKARVAMLNLTKDRLEAAKLELEMAKQAQVNAVKMQQAQPTGEESSQIEAPVQSQIQSQT